MKFTKIGVLLLALAILPSISYAKGAPLFFQTGDELFEIEGAPLYQDGFSLGYACKRFGIFGADVWTWDCELMAINIEEFSAGDINEKDKVEFSSKYALGDRKRSFWNHYGILALLAVLIGYIVIRKTSKS